MENVIKYLMQWYQKQSLLMVSALVATMMIVAGGLFFWASQFSYAITDESGAKTQSELASSGLQTIKRMVGDDQVWAETIQKEYDKLFANQQVSQPPMSYNENLTKQYSSIGLDSHKIKSN
jgi:hypothetical protein